MNFKVQFFKSTKSIYDSIIPDEYTFYYTTDTKQIFLGGIQLSNENFGQIWGAVNDLTQKVNEMEDSSAKLKIVSEGEDNVLSEQKTFYIYYSRPDTDTPDIKIGDGENKVSDLPFLLDGGSSSKFKDIEDYLQNIVAPHIANNEIHIREMEYINEQDRQAYGNISERNKWDNRVSAYVDEEYLNLENGNVIVQDNIPLRIRFKS